MIKTRSKTEYLTIKSISLKYNKYYTSGIRLRTKEKILEALRLNLKINVYDTLKNEWIILF